MDRLELAGAIGVLAIVAILLSGVWFAQWGAALLIVAGAAWLLGENHGPKPIGLVIPTAGCSSRSDFFRTFSQTGRKPLTL